MPFLRVRWLSLSVVVAALVVSAMPQQNSTEVPAPSIRVTTRMVLVDVVVTDKKGHPVAGLHPDDFEIEENGKAQKIASFNMPHETTSAPPLPPGFYSNRAEYRSPGGPVTVMLLDVINTAFSDQSYARRQMLNFVRDQYKPEQRMAIFTLTGSLNVLQDFTSDPKILYAALLRFQPQLQPQSVPGNSVITQANPLTVNGVLANTEATTAPAADTGSTLSPARAKQVASAQVALQVFQDAQSSYAEEQRTILTLHALDSLARILGGLPGRKNIIWVTGNLPFSLIPEDRTLSETELQEDLPSLQIHSGTAHAAGNYAATLRSSHGDDIRQTAARLASAQVAIYPVDARGLTISNSNEAQGVMREMASETGGRAYVNQNEIKFGVERAFEDGSATYTLGYYPQNKKWDGNYRTIKVKVKHDGVEFQHRHGYYAFDPTQLKSYSPQQEVTSALNDVVPSTMVAFTARALPASANPAAGKVGIDFLVDASTLSAEDSPGGKRLNVAFYATVFSPQGRMLAQRSQKVDRSFTTDIYKQILEKGMLLHIDIDDQPGDSQLRLAVQDNKTGLVGTLDFPLSASVTK